MPEVLLGFAVIGAIGIFLVYKWGVAVDELRLEKENTQNLANAIYERDQVILRLVHECDIHGSSDLTLLAEAREMATARIIFSHDHHPR